MQGKPNANTHPTERKSRSSMEMLKKAFSLAEKRLSGEKNRSITEVITNEVGKVPGEKIVNDVIAGALCDVFPRSFAVKREHKRIDIGLMNEDGEIVVAIEGKMMVSNSTSRNPTIKDSIDVDGIKEKLNGDKNSVKKDINNIHKKIGKLVVRYEIFVPIVYELYRTGGESEWTKHKKPWTTLPKYKSVRKGLVQDFNQWFKGEDNSIELIRATEPIELRDANKLWLEQSQWMYPNYKSLEAYVSFFAFGRLVKT